MEPYDPAGTIACLIKQLEKGREFARAEGQTIYDAIMVSKGITLLAHTATFSKYIIEWRQQTNNLKTWSKFNKFDHQANSEQRRAVTTTGKGGYTVAVQNISGVMLPPPEENHEAIENLNNIVQGIQTQSFDLKGLAQSNAVLTISNSVVMEQLAQMNVTKNAMQAQLKTL